ncbi:hypothetical protein L873DRAFT_856727 [Choiromyces venosus 120613-1]|uniref:Uncharacterized protein n=1 Tax=Choiromyces venosus 120613-1 TaxID=1336337 RepID=A0A3N4JP91_9PEZI|nr:hypothetical protein L873DRAFT_856727 [Choiromyces venosus 120613-1]
MVWSAQWCVAVRLPAQHSTRTTSGWKILAPPPFRTKSIVLYGHLSGPFDANKNILIIKLEQGVHGNLSCNNFFVLKKCCQEWWRYVLSLGRWYFQFCMRAPYKRYICEMLAAEISAATFDQCNLRAQKKKSYTIKFHGNFPLPVGIAPIVFSIKHAH